MIGNTLSHYKIISKLGQGGQGEVYLAEDSRLDRKVALKILPQHLSERAELRERFEREARAVSSLNHPHICTLYDIGEQDGIHYLVMEHLVGETLEARLAKGPLPLEQTLEYAIQIADALDKAHRQGVVHRDLKPSNIMLVKSGAKLLDFGLAKLQAADTPTNLSALPTEQANLTAEGTILGTLQYMAPEQLEGKEADSRTDIFAFGAVVYEMATGKKAFEGKSQASLIAAIMGQDPRPMAELQPMTPQLLDWVVKRCLAKEPDERVQTAADLMAELRLVTEVGTPVPSPAVTAPAAWKVAIPWSIALLIAVAAGVGFWILTRPLPQPLTKFVITPSSSTALTNDTGNDVAISPDGRHVVYRVLGESGPPLLQLRSLDDFVDRMIPGTEGAEDPFFSPDGQSIAFVAAGKLQRISLTGGTTITLYDVSSGFRGGGWDQEDTIVFAGRGNDLQRRLYRVSAAGGEAEQLAVVNADQGEVNYHRPQILPGGAAVLFTIWLGSENFQIGLLSLETGEPKIVIEGGREARYAPTGHLVYATAVGGTLMAAPFDLARLEVAGDPVPILEGVRNTPYRAVDYAFSNDGTLVYVPGTGDSPYIPGTLVWVDRSGQEGEAIVGEPLEFPRYPRLSPDGQRLTLTTGPGNQGDIWVYDLGGRPPFPLTFEGQNSNGPWTPDGKRVAFAITRDGPANLFWMPADGSTLEPEPLLTSPTAQVPLAWTPDGLELIFLQTNPEQQNNLMALPIEGEREPRFVVETQYPYSSPEHGAGAALSPDGRWLAYVSGVTGSPEIWVRPYPGPEVPIRISPSGGREPVWDSEGQELFYLEGNKMMAVKVASEPGFTSEPPQMLFEGNYVQANRPSYDVGSDGRFLMIKAAEEEEGQQGQINVVLNWFEELKRLVPTP